MIDLCKSAEKLQSAGESMSNELWNISGRCDTDEQRRACAESLIELKHLGESIKRTLELLSK